MLLLSRFTNESIMIGEDIEVKVARVDGNNVCLAIQAPKNVAISRKEIFKKIKMIMNSNNQTSSRDQ